MDSATARIFRAYDIRGIVGRDFDADWVERLGRACGAYFLSRGFSRAVVGHDCRLTSAGFQERMVRGLCATGVDVLFLDMVPTPVCYFAIRHLGYQAGVMITASHNLRSTTGSRSGRAEAPSTPTKYNNWPGSWSRTPFRKATAWPASTTSCQAIWKPFPRW
jgi:phosphomannomutase